MPTSNLSPKSNINWKNIQDDPSHIKLMIIHRVLSLPPPTTLWSHIMITYYFSRSESCLWELSYDIHSLLYTSHHRIHCSGWDPHLKNVFYLTITSLSVFFLWNQNIVWEVSISSSVFYHVNPSPTTSIKCTYFNVFKFFFILIFLHLGGFVTRLWCTFLHDH